MLVINYDGGTSNIFGCRYEKEKRITFIIARFDEIEVLQQLLQKGFDPNTQDQYGTSALHNAAANGNMYIQTSFQ